MLQGKVYEYNDGRHRVTVIGSANANADLLQFSNDTAYIITNDEGRMRILKDIIHINISCIYTYNG